MTIYYALLIISLIAMLLACLFLYLEIGRFGGFGAVPGTVSSLERPAILVAQTKLPLGHELGAEWQAAVAQRSGCGGRFGLASA